MNQSSHESSDGMPPSRADDLDVSRREFCKTGLLAAGAVLASEVLGPAPAAARSNTDLAYVPAVDQLQLFRTGELSPVDVLRVQIDRIQTLNPIINCITYEHFDQAMQAAKDSERRYAQGHPLPLDGLTVAIKDEHDREGWVTDFGSLLFANNPPASENAAIIDKLLAAGAVLHIQTTVPEFYLAGTTWTRLWGITRNPWNRQYSPGGSSGGSGAALAAGFTTLATGSDMGGSIRIPASQCGLYGFKPPFGRVATSEVPYESSGPLARGFQDLRLLQQIISGPDPKVHSSLRPKLDYPEQYPDVRGWRVAVDYATGIAELDASVRDGMARAVALLKDLGCTVETVDVGFRFSHPDGRNDFETFAKGLLSTSTGALIVAAGTQRSLLTRYVDQFVEKFLGDAGPVQALVADELIKEYHHDVQAKVFLAGFQALVMPTVTTPSVPADYQIDAGTDSFFIDGRPFTGFRYAATFPWNLMGRYPVVSVPIGRAASGVPVGLQIVANTFDDLTAFQLASAYSTVAPPFFAGANFPDFRDTA
jgi:amidase